MPRSEWLPPFRSEPWRGIIVGQFGRPDPAARGRQARRARQMSLGRFIEEAMAEVEEANAVTSQATDYYFESAARLIAAMRWAGLEAPEIREALEVWLIAADQQRAHMFRAALNALRDHPSP